MNPVASEFEVFHDFYFMCQPFFPAGPYFFFGNIVFRKGDKEGVMTSLTFHEFPVEVAQVFIFEALAQTFKTFTASGFNKRHGKQLVQ